MKNYYFKINLLPYREELKKERQKQFGLLSFAMLIAGGAIVFAVNGAISAQADTQENRNKFLKGEIESVKKEIEEIKSLKEQLAAMLARKQVVENLQLNRADAVLLMEELHRRLPDGMFLKSVRQSGEKVVIVGFTQSNGKVAAFARNLEESPWLQKSDILEVKSIQLPSKTKGEAPQKINEFTMNVFMERVKQEEPKDAPAGKDGKKPAAPAKTASAQAEKSGEKK